MRLRFVVLAAFVSALLLTVVGAAAGSTPVWTPPGFAGAADPMTTNVPYLAWAGEQVKLVAGTNEIMHFGRDHYRLEAKFSIEAVDRRPVRRARVHDRPDQRRDARSQLGDRHRIHPARPRDREVHRLGQGRATSRSTISTSWAG